MALSIYVVNPFGPYLKGAEIEDPDLVNAIRAGEHASDVVMVSDTIIVPPTPPPPATDLPTLLATYKALLQSNQETVALLAAQAALNTQQSAQLASAQQQIQSLSNTVQVLQARIDDPTGGVPIPANLADDRPLAEDDDVVLATDAGAILVGDVRI
jgi:hypothetical protein